MNCGEFKPKKRGLFKRIKDWWKQRKLSEQSSGMEIWALNELKLLEKDCEDEDGLFMQQLVTKNVMEIVKTFCKQEHSGFSANYTLNLIRRLLSHKPIKPLTGEDDEWEDVLDYFKDTNTQQNKRCSAVFRDNFDNSTAHYTDGKIFSNDGGRCWFTSKESIVPITFPFKVPLEPEYVYLDKEGNVITREEAKELFKEEE